MKTYKNIHTEICDFENLYCAYTSARKGKRWRSEVLTFSANLEENLIVIQNELINETYAVGKYREFYVSIPKKRLVMALPFKDRVVQWAIYRVIEPIMRKSFIYDSHACIRGRGAHGAVKRLKNWMRELAKHHDRPYYLKLDISKFFYRVDHEVLLAIMARKFPDEKLLRLLSLIIKSEDTPFGLPTGYSPWEDVGRLYNKGMPIGNLTSQLFANAYMNELDQYAKRELKIKHYIRYMDDIIILGSDKNQLHEYKDLITDFLETQLRLSLNDKTSIRPTTHGVEFCGYQVWPTHIKLRKSSALRAKRGLKHIQKQYADGKIDFDSAQRRLASYRGLFMHFNSYRLRRAIYGEPDEDGTGWFSLQRNTPGETADE